MKLKLPKVTLVMVETFCHELAEVAVNECLKKADFADVLVFSDKYLNIPGSQRIEVENWPSKLGWSEWLWYGVPEYVKTERALLLQWDAGIVNPSCWRDEFMDFDYIGAPWPWHTDGLNVGNSGFSLRSKRLQDFLVANRDKFPVQDPEDVACSRTYRRALEAEGFIWSGMSDALDFAFEYLPRPKLDHFGYHAMRNWAFVLSPDELEERVAMARKIPYIEKTGMIAQIRELAPHLAL